MLSLYRRFAADMPEPSSPRLWLHALVTALSTAAVLLSYFWPIGVW